MVKGILIIVLLAQPAFAATCKEQFPGSPSKMGDETLIDYMWCIRTERGQSAGYAASKACNKYSKPAEERNVAEHRKFLLCLAQKLEKAPIVAVVTSCKEQFPGPISKMGIDTMTAYKQCVEAELGAKGVTIDRSESYARTAEILADAQRRRDDEWDRMMARQERQRENDLREQQIKNDKEFQDRLLFELQPPIERID